MWRDCLINCLVGRIPIPVINHSAALQLLCRDLQNCIVIPAAPVYLQARVQVLVKSITAGAAVCFRESHPPLLSNFLDSPDTWRTGRCGEKLSHSDRELHLADLLPLPLLYENGLSEQLVRQKCLPASQCGWYCDPPPVHAEPGSKWGGGRGQFHLLPKPLSSCLFCLSVWADFSSYSTCKILTFVFRLPFFFFPPLCFLTQGGGRHVRDALVGCLCFHLFIYFGYRKCLPRGSLPLLSWTGGWRVLLPQEVLSTWRLIGNIMCDNAQKRLSSQCQISESHPSTSRRAKNTAEELLMPAIILAITSYPLYVH